MARRGLATQLCAYCGESPSTRQGDHIVARALVLERHRANLPKVPCCRECNDIKSRIEHYLASVLPFGSRQPFATEALLAVERRLTENRRLGRELQSGTIAAIDPLEWQDTIALPFDSDQLLSYAALISRALLFKELGERLPKEQPQRTLFPTPEADSLLTERLLVSMNGRRCTGQIGRGALRFDSLTSEGQPIVSVWRLVFFDGVTVRNESESTTPFIWSFIAPSEQITHLETLLR